MTIDIRCRDLLAKIKACKGAENAVLAGGAVRDEILGLKPKDYDIYVPAGSRVLDELYNQNIKPKGSKSLYESKDLKGVYDLTYEGISVQIMSSKFKNTEKFGEEIVNTFDYGICMIYYEGGDIIKETDQFLEDRLNEQLTLHKLPSMSRLPQAIDRFNYLNAKLGGHYVFRSSVLTLDPKQKEEDTFSEKKNRFTYHEVAFREEDQPAFPPGRIQALGQARAVGRDELRGGFIHPPVDDRLNINIQRPEANLGDWARNELERDRDGLRAEIRRNLEMARNVVINRPVGQQNIGEF